MRIISSQAQEALDTGRFAVRCLCKIMPIGSAPLCFWDDVGTITLDGDDYVGAPGRFTIDASVSSSDLSSHSLQLTFSGLDAAAVAIVEGYQWHQCPVLVQRVIIATDAPQVLHVVPEFSGFLDVMTWTERAGGTSTLVLSCESAAREMSRSGARTSSDADQRERDPTDGFFSFAASAVNETINWGQAPEQAPAKKGGLAGLMDKIF